MRHPSNLPPKKCEYCLKEFVPNTSWQRFDCEACRNKAAWQERKSGVQFLRTQKVLT